MRGIRPEGFKCGDEPAGACCVGVGLAFLFGITGGGQVCTGDGVGDVFTPDDEGLPVPVPEGVEDQNRGEDGLCQGVLAGLTVIMTILVVILR